MSNNLNLDQVADNQDDKETTINDQAGQLDAALTVKADFTITDTNARTLTNTEFRRTFLFHITNGSPAPSAAITLTVPAISRGVFAVLNTTSFDVTVTISGQSVTAPVVATGSDNPTLLTCDGVNVRLASSGGSGGGTSKLSFQSTGNAVTSSSTASFDLTSFMNRGMIREIKITETGGVSTGTYDVRFYGKDTKVAADLFYSVDAIDSTADSRIFTDRLVVGYEDLDNSGELHMQIDNNDGAQNMTFTIDIIAEVFLAA